MSKAHLNRLAVVAYKWTEARQRDRINPKRSGYALTGSHKWTLQTTVLIHVSFADGRMSVLTLFTTVIELWNKFNINSNVCKKKFFNWRISTNYESVKSKKYFILKVTRLIWDRNNYECIVIIRCKISRNNELTSQSWPQM